MFRRGVGGKGRELICHFGECVCLAFVLPGKAIFLIRILSVGESSSLTASEYQRTAERKESRYGILENAIKLAQP